MVTHFWYKAHLCPGKMIHWGWAAASAAAATVLIVAGGFRHFTWWGFTAFTLYLALKATGKADNRELFFGAVSMIITLGVLSMATLGEEGSMLADSYRDMGPLGYFAGTFVVHYLPPAVIIASMQTPVWSWREFSLLSGGMGLFAVYVSMENPDEIYGVSINSVMASALGVALIGITAWSLWLFASH